MSQDMGFLICEMTLIKAISWVVFKAEISAVSKKYYRGWSTAGEVLVPRWPKFDPSHCIWFPKCSPTRGDAWAVRRKWAQPGAPPQKRMTNLDMLRGEDDVEQLITLKTICTSNQDADCPWKRRITGVSMQHIHICSHQLIADIGFNQKYISPRTEGTFQINY